MPEGHSALPTYTLRRCPDCGWIDSRDAGWCCNNPQCRTDDPEKGPPGYPMGGYDGTIARRTEPFAVVRADAYDGVARHRDGCVAKLEAIRAEVLRTKRDGGHDWLAGNILAILDKDPTP